MRLTVINFDGTKIFKNGKVCYFCTAKTAMQALLFHGPIVQWIEYQIPVLTIWVRVPMGSHLKDNRN